MEKQSFINRECQVSRQRLPPTLARARKWFLQQLLKILPFPKATVMGRPRPRQGWHPREASETLGGRQNPIRVVTLPSSKDPTDGGSTEAWIGGPLTKLQHRNQEFIPRSLNQEQLRN